MFNQDIGELLIRVVVVLLALTVHEFCHAYFAYRMGDPTAYRMGRCTLNPLKHLDPLGTICLMFAPIGWAKPVPVNPMNFRDLRKGEIVTTAAGPVSNLVQAIFWALVIRLVFAVTEGHGATYSQQTMNLIEALLLLGHFGVFLNVALAVFNFLPIFPLDGFHITKHLMSPGTQERFEETRVYGPFIILGLVLLPNLTGNPQLDILSTIIWPPAELIFKYVAGVSFAS